VSHDLLLAVWIGNNLASKFGYLDAGRSTNLVEAPWCLAATSRVGVGVLLYILTYVIPRCVACFNGFGFFQTRLLGREIVNTCCE
jgi:hypothetical protein